MLSQDDRRRLEAIERDLAFQDPGLARRVLRPPWLRRRLILLGIGVLLLVGASASAAATVGWFAALGVVPIAAVSVVMVRHLRRYRRWTRPPDAHRP